MHTAALLPASDSVSTAFIIDDDRHAVIQLITLMSEPQLCRPYGFAPGVTGAIEILRDHPVDILFIRIDYWDDWLKEKQQLVQFPAHTVFLSRRSDKCCKSLIHEIDFHLQPPYAQPEVNAVFQLLVNPCFTSRPTDFFFLRVCCRYHVIYFSSLRSIESKAGSLTIKTSGTEFTVTGTLAGFQRRLPMRLNRTSRSTLIHKIN
jgi:hypothetical protein